MFPGLGVQHLLVWINVTTIGPPPVCVKVRDAKRR